jgi:hypothetical protein
LDQREAAYDAARYLKSRHPKDFVEVFDRQTEPPAGIVEPAGQSGQAAAAGIMSVSDLTRTPAVLPHSLSLDVASAIFGVIPT